MSNTSILKKGTTGKTVTDLQKALNALGRKPPLKLDGNFGAKTDEAVREFQAAHGLVVDGEVGPKTRAAIVEQLAKPAACEPAPVIVNAPIEPAPKIEVCEPPPPPPPAPRPTFTDGWYNAARRSKSIRAGGPITPRGVVVHATACVPGTMASLLRQQATQGGNGSSYHFLLGRRAPTATELLEEQWPSAGLAQIIPIIRNGNHAGGARAGFHGKVIAPGLSDHPNLHYVGIEIDCACRLQFSHGVAIHPETSTPIAPEDVWLDERGKPWHRVTDYQLETLGRLLDDLDAVLVRFPSGTTIAPNGSVPSWGMCSGTRFIGHVTLDPANRSDPGPQVMAWLRERYDAKR